MALPFVRVLFYHTFFLSSIILSNTSQNYFLFSRFCYLLLVDKALFLLYNMFNNDLWGDFMAKKQKIQSAEAANASRFDGRLLGQIGTSILAFFALILPLLPAGGLAVLGFTLFADLSKEILIAFFIAIGIFAFFMLWLGLAWATVVVLRWEYRHTVINGKRLVFKGKKGALWGQYLKWFFLTVLTLTIYGLWVWIKMKKWVLSNVETVESKEKENDAENTMNAYLPMSNPYFSPMPNMPNTPNVSNTPNVPQGQMPIGYFPPYPYFPSYQPIQPMPPYSYGDVQNLKNKETK